MKKELMRTFTLDLVVVVSGFICRYLYFILSEVNHKVDLNSKIFYVKNSGLIALGVLFAIIMINLVPLNINCNKDFYKNKNALIPFLIIETVVQLATYLLNRFYGINNTTVNGSNMINVMIVQIFISLTIFICYFYNIRLKDYNWNISLISLVCIASAYMSYRMPSCISFIENVGYFINVKIILSFILGTLTHSFFFGFFEEVLWRGFFISGLKGFDLSNSMCNVLQAIAFGLSRIMVWGTPSWALLLLCAGQAVLGYVLGKIYFKTKSLTLCIIFHGLLGPI